MSIKKYSSGSWVTVPYRKYETATDTITSLPQTIIGDGQNISAYTIKGNMSQSGTPTPSNPIYPQETGDKTANLFDKADTSLQSHLCYNSNNDTLKIGLAIGSIVLPCSPNTTYSIRRKGGLSDTFNACYTTETPDENVSAYGYVESSDRYTYGLTITTGANAAYLIIVMYNSNFENPGTWQQMVDNLVVVEGSTVPSEYIPFGYKIPILSNGVAYPVYLAEPLRKIGDSVDTAPSTGTATYNIKKLVITGEERWYESNGLFYFAPTNFTNRSIVLCTHYPYYDGAGTSAPDKSVLTKYGGGLSIWIKDSSYTTLADFKQFLADQYAAGTPVTVWYVLATAQTESFTAPSIPTSGTSQSFDVDTTLAPSEVSLTYHGWHEHSDTKYTSG